MTHVRNDLPKKKKQKSKAKPIRKRKNQKITFGETVIEFGKGAEGEKNVGVSEESRVVRVFSKLDMLQGISKTLNRPYEQTVKLVESMQGTTFEVVLASVMKHAYETGDVSRLEALFNRAIGTLNQKITITPEAVEDYASLPPEERQKRIEQLNEVLEYKRRREMELAKLNSSESVVIDVTPPSDPTGPTESGSN